MLAYHHTETGQPEQAWLTNLEATLLSDVESGRLTTILERLPTLLHEHRDMTGLSVEDKTIPRLRVGLRIDRGIRRRDRPNEDSLFVSQGALRSSDAPPTPFALLVVAEGMGGQSNGQEAGRLALQYLIEQVGVSLFSKQMTPAALLALLIEGVQEANHRLYLRNQERLSDMGTTIMAALVSDGTAYVANVGDSRAYLYRASPGLAQITRDHSLVAAPVQAGTIDPDDIYSHPWRNVIYRCLGAKHSVEVDTFVVPLAAGDTLLLCSDGLWGMVRDPQLAEMLGDTMTDPQQAANALVERALANGGADNIAVVVAQMR